jgi:uncharacterized protein YggE
MAAAAVLGLTVPAAAQTPVPAPVAAPQAPGVSVLAPAQALAGITVTGRATVTIAPDRVRVEVRLYPRNVTATRLGALADDVAAAMRSGGIADAKVALPLVGFLGPNSTVAVVGTVAKPTRPSLESILRSTLAAVPDASATALANAYQVTTSYQVDDCSAGEARAQAAAMADARARAERAAAAAGLRLGPILSVNEAGTFAPIACSANLEEPNNGGFGAGDPFGAIAVPISVNAVVTFAIGGAAARP